MKLKIEYNTNDIKELILNDLRSKLGNLALEESQVTILVKTKQNYKADWEIGDFKVTYED